MLAEDKEQTLAVETAGPISVRCDPAILHQALLNLLYNAIRYTPSEGTIRVSARATPSGEAAIAVVDTGPGIPIEHRERIFERFYRVDKARSRATGGTGLGLSIVRHVAEAHGGEVTVESTEGEGSTFRLTLPLAHSASDVAEAS